MNIKRPALTRRERDVLMAAAKLQSDRESITIAKLSARLGIPRQNLRTYLIALHDAKYIKYEASERRTAVIQVFDDAYKLLKLKPQLLSLPIVGEVAAGQPGYADEFVEGHAARLQDILDIHEGDFLLKVRGESMIGIGIYPGDLVVIHPMQTEPKPGEIALVAVPGDGTATLKRWHRNNGTVTLISENPEFAPMTFKAEDILIQGCLVGHIGTGRTRQLRHTVQE